VRRTITRHEGIQSEVRKTNYGLKQIKFEFSRTTGVSRGENEVLASEASEARLNDDAASAVRFRNNEHTKRLFNRGHLRSTKNVPFGHIGNDPLIHLRHAGLPAKWRAPSISSHSAAISHGRLGEEDHCGDRDVNGAE
jgi:hypothetical protein